MLYLSRDPAKELFVTNKWRRAGARRDFPRGATKRRTLVKTSDVVGRAEKPLERVVVTLGTAAAIDVVADFALESVGHVEDHPDEVVRRDLDARGAHDAPLLIVPEDFLELAVERVGAGAKAHGIFHRHCGALRHVLEHEVRRVAEQGDAPSRPVFRRLAM